MPPTWRTPVLQQLVELHKEMQFGDRQAAKKLDSLLRWLAKRWLIGAFGIEMR